MGLMSELRAAAWVFSKLLLELPDGEWPGWMVFVLELLEEDDAAYGAGLDEVRQSISARLAGGRW